MAGHDAVVSVDLADRGRFPRHRCALYARGGADIGRAAFHRGGLRLHARHRAADAGRHARACRGAAYERPGVCRAEMVRRGVPALHGLAGVARDGRAVDRYAPRGFGALQPPRHRDRDPDQHPQSETLDLLPGLPAAVHSRRRAAPAGADAGIERSLHGDDVCGVRGLRPVRRLLARPRHHPPKGDGLAAPEFCRRVRRTRRQARVCGALAASQCVAQMLSAVLPHVVPANALGGVDSKDSLLGANQIQDCFWEAVLGVMERLILSDAAWERMAPLIIGRPDQKGSTGRDNRMFVEGVLWIVRTGSPWRDLPEAFGDWNSVFRRFSRWSIKGVWWRIFEAMSDDPDFEYLIVDSTIVRAHQHAAGAKKGGLKIRRSAARAAA